MPVQGSEPISRAARTTLTPVVDRAATGGLSHATTPSGTGDVDVPPGADGRATEIVGGDVVPGDGRGTEIVGRSAASDEARPRVEGEVAAGVSPETSTAPVPAVAAASR